MISFPSGYEYRVCADHEREYVRGYGAVVLRPHWMGDERQCWCGFRHPLVTWNTQTRQWVPVAAGWSVA